MFTADEAEASLKGAWDWHDRLVDAMDPNERGNVFDPQEAYMSRIKDTYRYSMLIKCPKGRRREYTGLIEQIREDDRKRKNRYNAVADINPYSFV